MGDKKIRLTTDFERFRVDVAIRCRACGHTTYTAGRAFAELFGNPTSIQVATKRLRCAECGAKGAKVAPWLCPD